MSDKGNRYKVIGTKVSPRAYRLLKVLAEKKGLTVYEMFQMAADTFVRYMSDEHNLTPEMEEAMEVFERMVGWKNALNHADPTASPHVGEATYYMEQDGKKGSRAVHITRPFFGDWRQTENVILIIERTFELITPERYRKLRRMAAELGCGSILEFLDAIIARDIIEDVNDAEIRRGFEDCYRAENTKAVAYGERTRRKKHYDVDAGVAQSEQAMANKKKGGKA